MQPRVLRLMREAGCMRAIATAASAVHVAALLRHRISADGKQVFSAVVAGDQVAKKKTAPDVYERCVALLPIALGRANAMEDSPPGVAAARQAGILVLATPSVYTTGENFTGSDVLVRDLGDPAARRERAVAGFCRRWVELADLQRLAAGREIAPETEVAQ